ncbi:FAD-dependent oxidoreductase domain-containing protein 1 [Microplitis demolitor]|uniref:FAD-dependent oxidoreductase domain-containing protein 1 n=1 Tax=Microplitis demolitor TaxID=69319 RepID=UPI0004CD3B5A|nr:FAD-dependent oxidoreductase domain-containing protein 1 [Microplitis demolitor]
MLRNIIRSSSKLFTRNSRSFHSSSIVHDKDNEDQDYKAKLEKDEEGDDYWTTAPDPEHPVLRTMRVMGKEVRDIKQQFFFWKEPTPPDWDEWEIDSTGFPTHFDVLIIGGGIMGMCAAYWMKKEGGNGFQVVVVEDKPMEEYTSPMILTASTLTQQYALEENIEMALFGAEFIRDVNKYLGIDQKPPIDLEFRPHGNLILAKDEDAERLMKNVKLQNSMGASTTIYTATQLQRMFPWLNTEGIAIGTMGAEKEGSFNPYALLKALRNKCLALGVEIVTAEVKGFIFSKVPNFTVVSPSTADLYSKLNHAVVKTAAGEKKVMQFAVAVIAAGSQSGHISSLMKIGRTCGVRSVPLPVIPRPRHLCYFEAPEGPNLNTPIVNDTSGCFFRRENLTNLYMASKIPRKENIETMEDISNENLLDDENYFQREILPSLVERVPSFKNSKLVSSKAGFYDYNYFDENGVVGPHPLYSNIFFATGFGEQSIIQAPAVGRGITEYVRNTNYKTIDLYRLNFERFITYEEMRSKVV